MCTFESSVTIARPLEDVYRHFLDLDQNTTDPDTRVRGERAAAADTARNAFPLPPWKGPRDNDPFRLT